MENNNIKNMPMFLAMRDIFYGGEFSYWLNKQPDIPWAAMKEYIEAMEYFEKETGFSVNEQTEKEFNELYGKE
jgi:hypothetical protein